MILTVLTCPRPGGASYVEQTLDWIDIERVSGVRKFVVCDSTPVFRLGWQTRCVRRGWTPYALPANKWAGWETLRIAVEYQDDLLFLEDDVAPAAPAALQAMVDATVPGDVLWVSFFHPSRPPGRYPVAGFSYCQALRVPLRTAAGLLSLPGVVAGDWEGARGFDEALAALGRGGHFLQADALVAHVGLVSVANPTR